MNDLKRIPAKDYNFDQKTDITLFDLGLLEDELQFSNTEQYKASLQTVKEILGTPFTNQKEMENLLDSRVESGEFEKFKVNLGWRSEIVWRKL